MGLAVALAVIVIATQASRTGRALPTSTGPVYIDLARAAVHMGMPDRIEAVNGSGAAMAMISCGAHTTKSLPADRARAPGLNCGSDTSMAPHSRLFLGSPSLPPGAKPGVYWVWIGYTAYGNRAGVRRAYTELTVLAPPRQPPLSLVLAHATIRANSSDSVEAVNRTGYRVATTGTGMMPRTSADFRLPQSQILEWDGPGDAVAPHSTQRLAETLWPTYPPGKYWVWTAYEVGGNATTLYAYTKLTIVAG